MPARLTVPPPHLYPEFVENRYIYPAAFFPTQHSHHRIHTYVAHALVLFNVYGLPLSSGVWLEYYFTSLHPSRSLLATSMIFGVQFVCVGLAVGPAAWAYHRWPERWWLQMFSSTLIVCGAWLGIFIAEHFWVLILCHGALTGLSLGVLGTVSALVLSTHYKLDISVVSTQCMAAGFAGAVAYTVLTWACLRIDAVKMACGITLALMSGTLLIAMSLARPCIGQTLDASSSYGAVTMRSRYTSWISTSVLPTTTILLSPAILLPPLVLPLILTRHPSAYCADISLYALFAMFGIAMLTSTLIVKIPPARLSPTTLFVASCLLAGTAIVLLIQVPRLEVIVPCAALYGVGLGGVSTLWINVLMSLMEEGASLGNAICLVMTIGGLTTGGRVVGAAVVLQSIKRGPEIILGSSAGTMVVAGLLVGACALVKHRKRKVKTGIK